MIAAVSTDGAINAQLSYTPFGPLLEASSDSSLSSALDSHTRRFNDKYHDSASSLAYYGARYYDRTLQAWTQSDPLYRLAPDAAGTEPRRSSLYTMSLNNLLRYIDPDGRTPDESLGKFVGALENAIQEFGEELMGGMIAAYQLGVDKNGFPIGYYNYQLNQMLREGLDPRSPGDTLESVDLPIPGIGGAVSNAVFRKDPLPPVHDLEEGAGEVEDSEMEGLANGGGISRGPGGARKHTPGRGHNRKSEPQKKKNIQKKQAQKQKKKDQWRDKKLQEWKDMSEDARSQYTKLHGGFDGWLATQKPPT